MLKYIVKNKRKIIGRPEMLQQLLKVKGLDRSDITVYSSWRSLSEQKELVKAGKSKTLYSNHRRGVAVDIIGWEKVENEMRKNGMINDISWDKNHFVLGGEVSGTNFGLIDVLPEKLEEYKNAPVTEENTKTIQDTTSAEKPLESPNLAPETKPMDKQDYLEPKKQATQAISDLNNLISIKMQGYKTYTGIAILLLGALGFGNLIGEKELAETVDAVLKVIGTVLAVYGRYKAK